MKRNQNYERGPTYQGVIADIQAAKQRQDPAVLNIHIPGTGARAEDPFPTRTALNDLRSAQGRSGKTPSASIFLEGIAASGAGYVEPLQRDPTSLDPKKKKFSLKKFFLGDNPSQIEDVIAVNPSATGVASFAFGKGDETNNQLIINTLSALENDGALPETIFLSGHSRGGINCISMANAIYQAFGDKIKIDICVTDPVPGLGQAENRENTVIPPNVRSMTCYYAQRGTNDFLDRPTLATPPDAFVLANPNTTLTTYMVPGTHHGSILSNGNVKAGIQNITMAANGLATVNHAETPRSTPTQEMIGVGAREGLNYYRTSPISVQLPAPLAAALQRTRAAFDPSYSREPAQPSIAVNSAPATAMERKNILDRIYDSAKGSIKDAFKNIFTDGVNPSQPKDFPEAHGRQQVNRAKLTSFKTAINEELSAIKHALENKGMYYCDENPQDLKVLQSALEKIQNNQFAEIKPHEYQQLDKHCGELLQSNVDCLPKLFNDAIKQHAQPPQDAPGLAG
jgi:hypothetical protein